VKPPSVPGASRFLNRTFAAHHHLVVAAARTVGIEILRFHAMFDEVFPGGRRLRYASGGRDVIGRHAVADEREHPRALDVVALRRLARHAVEERRPLHVRRIRVPRKPFGR
jgi:hypothetical protein